MIQIIKKVTEDLADWAATITQVDIALRQVEPMCKELAKYALRRDNLRVQQWVDGALLIDIHWIPPLQTTVKQLTG